MQEVLTDKVNYLIFLEDHTQDHTLTDRIANHLNLEGKLVVFIENRLYSKQTKVLKKYAKSLIKKEKVNKEDLIKEVENTPDYFEPCFSRQMELIEYAAKTGKEFKVVPLDIRNSPSVYEQFKKQDKIFPKLIEEAPDLEKKEFDFFEEHAFGAWYTRKKIDELLKTGFESFVYSVGYEHHASLEYYLKGLTQRTNKSLQFGCPEEYRPYASLNRASLEYCLKELSQRTPKSLKFVFLKNKDFGTYYKRMMAFFLPEYRGKYCLHCGKDSC